MPLEDSNPQRRFSECEVSSLVVIIIRKFSFSRWRNHFRGKNISRKEKRGFILEVFNLKDQNPRGSNFFQEEGLNDAKAYDKKLWFEDSLRISCVSCDLQSFLRSLRDFDRHHSAPVATGTR